MNKHFLKWLGWTRIIPQKLPPKSVICIAPHTSNSDYILGRLYAKSLGLKSHFLMKKEWFFFPLGLIFKIVGGIPINRKAKGGMVQSVINQFNKHKHFHVAITPEGTRKARDRWKTGFWRIATEAKVPIQLAVIDYKKKCLGIFETFIPTGNMEQDILYIRSKYNSEQAKKPELFIDL